MCNSVFIQICVSTYFIIFEGFSQQFSSLTCVRYSIYLICPSENSTKKQKIYSNQTVTEWYVMLFCMLIRGVSHLHSNKLLQTIKIQFNFFNGNIVVDSKFSVKLGEKFGGRFMGYFWIFRLPGSFSVRTRLLIIYANMG